MKSALRFLISTLVSIAWPVGAQQPYGAWHFLSPYDGANVPTFPLDLSKAALGDTKAEACAQRTRLEHNTAAVGDEKVVYVGMMPNGLDCGFIWLNPNGNVLVNADKFRPVFNECAFFDGINPQYPRPPLCPLDCPANQKNPVTGKCWHSDPKNGGEPCPKCANPINPATGNKFQAETDLASSGPQLRFVRYYNSGLPAHNKVFGGFWLHTYNSRILLEPAIGEATYYRADGKAFVFSLQGSSWVGDADVADKLTEVKNAQGLRTGWTYLVQSTEDTEHYDASGVLVAIQRRSGLTTTLIYTDGTDGSTTGNGAFVLDTAGNPTTTVMEKGFLLRVADHFGRALTFGHDSQRRIVKITDPAGGIYLYTYTAAGNGLSNLASVTYPDTRQRIYHYNESANTSGTNKPNALTGITDENSVRFATYKYGTVGRAIESLHHAGTAEVNRYQLTYNGIPNETVVTDPLGTVRTYSFQPTLGVVKNTALSLPEAGALGAALSYDANGNVSSRTDFNDNRTSYSYDLARNLETSRVEGLTSVGGTTPQTRTISTQWHTTFRLPTVIAEPLRKTTLAYDADGTTCGARGAICSKTIQATTDANGSQGFSATLVGSARTWTYTYDANGSVLTVNGPRTDVADITTYTYYPNNAACPTTNGGHATGCRGQVETVFNALSQITSITDYNAHGQPLRIVDPNGLTTTMTYDQRQRLTSRNVGGEATVYEYDFVGQLTKVISPDTSFVSYTYDDAHRLTQIQDKQGNKIVYTLDNMGNRTLEEVRDPGNVLAQKRSREFNNLNRLFKELGATNQTTEYGYDDQGNVTSVKDPLLRITGNQYDALNRLKQITAPPVGDPPASPVTQYAYNGLDALIHVTDPRNLVTGYTVDGLGNLTQQSSPDTGNTINTYDEAGNLFTRTDARGQTTTYAYDALNRVTTVTFRDALQVLRWTQTYVYDQGTNGIGRLSSITDTNESSQVISTIQYGYDQHGRVTSETRTMAGAQYGVAYRYDTFGRLDRITYPSGRTVTYGFDPLGRVSGITTQKPGASEQTVVSNVTYHPFGGVKGYTLGNNQVYARGIDLDGRIESYNLGTTSQQNPPFSIGYDDASRIVYIDQSGGTPPNAISYGYDNLDRLMSAMLVPGSTSYGYDYDSVGNRILSTGKQYTYSSTSNRIESITGGSTRNFQLDANGSTTDDGINTYGYDARGRMTQATSAIGLTEYKINALGQRIRKTNSQTDRIFHYDAGGRLIAETDPGGGTKRELIYLGDIPVGVVQ